MGLSPEVRENPIPYILMASYLYYCREEDTPLSDSDFDELCKIALAKFPNISHRLKHLITEEDLKAGTLYALENYRYPEGLKRCALQWKKGTLG